MTLTEFLMQRIAEDEADARRASESARSGGIARWRDDPGRGDGQSVVWNGVGQAVVSHANQHQGGHIARWDPARVLAECEAKKGIISEPFSDERGNVYQWEAALEWLALPYADHPDYQQEWKL